MIRYDVKTVRVESQHVAQGVLINEDAFNPALHKKIELKKPEQMPADVKKIKVK